MPEFCDVAVPVPLDAVFTYRVNGTSPVVGGRVVVPFRAQRHSGIVVELHNRPPKVAAKDVYQVIDAEPALDPDQLQLGRWIADYYVAPIGEVLRSMLPLNAEFRRARGYRISDKGMDALHATAERGSSLRLAGPPEQQAAEIAVLNHLLDRDVVREEALRSATDATRPLLTALLRRKWIELVDVSAVRNAARTVKIAVLNEAMEPRCAEAKKGRALNSNQEKLLAALRQAGGRAAVEQLRELDIPRTTLDTLAKRGLAAIEEQPAEFTVSRLKGNKIDFLFTPAQKQALRHICVASESRQFSVTLLHGVTGSGKTAVYLAAMQKVLNDGRGAILLVPEIGLTPAAAANLHEVFGEEVAILHSGLSDAERAEQWHRIHRGEARIAVGTRSAVFAPVHDLALIVVDEEHDNSYKQEETPRYHARDVAIVRARNAKAAIVLGSATPSLETYHNAQSGKYSLVELKERIERRPLPEVEIVDMRLEFQVAGKEQVLSRALHQAVTDRLERGEQTMLLLNRRGYSPVVLCRTCGETVQCKHCAMSLTHHKGGRRLECHYCGYTERVPERCPKCGSDYVQFLGTGSERLEELLHQVFPQARIARLDRDTVRGRDDFERILADLHAGDIDILVGTQMIAKGHDIHGVTLVGVVGADTGLAMPDFRAAERTFQLLTQVAGRAGRGDAPGEVIVQTWFPEHYAVQFAARHDYRGFYEKESRYRSWMKYPPFSALANFLVRSDSLDLAMKWSGQLGRWLEQQPKEGIRALGPAPAPLSKLKNDYRYHFVLKSQSRARLNVLLRAMLAFAAQQKIPRANVIADVDAVSLL
jgi:primosomal protein N' (replication factor Y)